MAVKIHSADSTTSCQLTSLDLPLRYIMIGMGVFPGSCIPSLRKSLKVALGVWQMVLAIIFLITMIYAVVNVWDHEEDQDLTLFVYKIFFMMMAFTTPLDCLIFAASGNLFKRFESFYDQLMAVQQHLGENRVPICWKQVKSVTLGIIIFYGILTLALMIPFTYDYAHQKWNLDPIFDSFMMDRQVNATGAVAHWPTVIVVVWSVVHIYTGIHISLKLAYYNCLFYIVFTVFQSYIHQLKQKVDDHPDEATKNISIYRQIHYELCNLVECANKLLRLPLGSKIFTYSVGILLISYLASIGLALTKSGTRDIMVFWGVTFACLLLVDIVICQMIQDKVCSPYVANLPLQSIVYVFEFPNDAHTTLCQNLIGCSTLSQQNCKLIGRHWKILRREL